MVPLRDAAGANAARSGAAARFRHCTAAAAAAAAAASPAAPLRPCSQLAGADRRPRAATSTGRAVDIKQQLGSSPAPQSATRPSRRLPPPPDLGGADPRGRWNAASIALLGDAVWEACVRTALLLRHRHAGPVWRASTSDAAIARVSTQALSAAHDVLASGRSAGGPAALGFALTADERAVLRWAANSVTVAAPPHATRLQYRKATAFEALVAHLYLTDGARLDALVAALTSARLEPLWVGGGGGRGGAGAGAVVALSSEEEVEEAAEGAVDLGGSMDPSAARSDDSLAAACSDEAPSPAAAADGAGTRQQSAPPRPSAAGFGGDRRRGGSGLSKKRKK